MRAGFSDNSGRRLSLSNSRLLRDDAGGSLGDRDWDDGAVNAGRGVCVGLGHTALRVSGRCRANGGVVCRVLSLCRGHRRSSVLCDGRTMLGHHAGWSRYSLSDGDLGSVDARGCVRLRLRGSTLGIGRCGWAERSVQGGVFSLGRSNRDAGRAPDSGLSRGG